MDFTPFPKIPRLRRETVITEKLDGTNAQIVISPTTDVDLARLAEFWTFDQMDIVSISRDRQFVMRAGSRSRWITPGKVDGKSNDNYGFAGWAQRNADELFKLGEGQHFGEWFGAGIQRGYGLAEKRFALFNTARWGEHNPNTPACCHVVPVLSRTNMAETSGIGSLPEVLEDLREYGSRAVPGFMRPEGVIVYHTASKQMFKVLLENDDTPKGQQG
jgi:hypothetical protein